jgi:TRAP-type C4-dicarboxylate transport system permease large subunit
MKAKAAVQLILLFVFVFMIVIGLVIDQYDIVRLFVRILCPSCVGVD